ncbi:ComF family protein [Leptolyngbya ohadii]|uniref:ComF family protein n=1 Tax=Leptolyngbya ohadii TaxID=1962290 RepID=UPI0019D4E7FF|nr:ComF family protein [Leptolyngbya ohadii]
MKKLFPAGLNRRALHGGIRLLDWLLQKPCPLCDRLTPSDLCSSCWIQVDQCQLPPSKKQALANSSLQNGELREATEPLKPLPEISAAQIPVFAWGSYSGALKQTIAALKYQNQPQLARPLGDRLGKSWLIEVSGAGKLTESLAVIPIPLHAEKQQQRGFNQAERLAAAFCDRTGLPLVRQGLVRVRSTEAQFRLNAANRAENLNNAFQVGTLPRSMSSQVLLIDDIYTTGATARAAVQALQARRISVWGIAVIARA